MRTRSKWIRASSRKSQLHCRHICRVWEQTHIHDETLERYDMDRLPEADAAPFEEHLLVRHECQVRLARIGGFLAGLQSGLGSPQ